MQFYKVSCDDTTSYLGTRAEAHVVAKNMAKRPERYDRIEIRVQEVECFVNRETVIEMLNGGEPDMKALRTWQLSPRLALDEIPNGE